MDLKSLRHDKRLVAVVLLSVSALLVVVALVKVVDFFMISVGAGNVVEKAVAYDQMDPNDIAKHMAKGKATADGLKKQNLFAPPPPKRHPVSSVAGIFGNEVLINDNWYKVGDKIGDAEIVAIETTLVKIKWDGKVTNFAPISAITSAPESKADAKVVASQEQKPQPGRTPQAPKAATVDVNSTSAEEDPLAWMGVELPANVREMVLQKWNSASDEEKAKAKEEWNKLPQEQKQQMIDMMASQGGG